MAAGSGSNISLGGERRHSQHLISTLSAGVSVKVPHPGQWTMVRELNIENRDPCQIWRSGINQMLRTLKQKMDECALEIEKLEIDIEKEQSNLSMVNRQTPHDTPSDDD